MKLTPKIQKAINKAAELHKNQTRKGIELPYIVHPFSVAMIILGYTNDENIIAAGLLHDVLEDAKDYNFKDLKKDFGEKIATIVKEVSQDGPNLGRENWQERKESYLRHLRSASYEALMICAAGKVHKSVL